MIDSGSFAVVIAYFFVPLSFLVLRHKDPDMERPFRIHHPRIVGGSAVVLAIALLSVYMPWSPSALIWPYEWAMLLTWVALGGLLFLRRRVKQTR
jgi:amino acid transporter